MLTSISRSNVTAPVDEAVTKTRTSNTNNPNINNLRTANQHRRRRCPAPRSTLQQTRTPRMAAIKTTSTCGWPRRWRSSRANSRLVNDMSVLDNTT